MAVNKVIYDNRTLIDITDSTVDAAHLAEGYTAYDASGTKITGALSGGSTIIIDEAGAHGDTIRHITTGETVEGSTTLTSNGSHNVAHYATAVVNVPNSDDDFRGVIERSATNVTVPNGVTRIAYGPFLNFYGLESVSLPDGVTSIDDSAFNSCVDLEHINFPNSVTSIGSYAFYYCSSLDFTALPSGLTSIEDGTFGNCSSLSLTSLPSGVTDIGQDAFKYCTSLALTSLPSGVTSIASKSFADCTNLAVTSFPNNLTSIGDSAFIRCSHLAATSLPNNLTSIGQYAFYSCSSLALNSLPSGLTSIGQFAFGYCPNITITRIPSGVTSIGTYTFSECTGLTSITSDGVLTSIGTRAFSSDQNLVSALFPNASLTYIGEVFGSSSAYYACQNLAVVDIGYTRAISSSAFANCYCLQTLVLRKSDAICALYDVSAFLNTPMRGYSGLTGTIYVPSALISTYQTAGNWSTIYNAGYLTFAPIEGSPYEL